MDGNGPDRSSSGGVCEGAIDARRRSPILRASVCSGTSRSPVDGGLDVGWDSRRLVGVRKIGRELWWSGFSCEQTGRRAMQPM